MTERPDLQKFYEEEYPRGLELPGIPLDDDFMYGQVLRELRPYLQPGLRVLDLGCNTGNLSLYMARQGCEVLGIDLARNAIAVAQAAAAHYGLTQAHFEAMDFLQEWKQPEAFDFVLCSHVVEHVSADGSLVKHIAFALKPGGQLLLLTPSVYSSTHMVSRLCPGFFQTDEEVGHLRRYTRNGLAQLITEAGLNVEAIVHLDGAFRDWIIQCKPLRRSQKVWGRRYIRNGFNALDRWLAVWFFPAAFSVHACKARPSQVE